MRAYLVRSPSGSRKGPDSVPAGSGPRSRTSFSIDGTRIVDDGIRIQIPWRRISEQQLESVCRALTDREADAPIRSIEFMDNQLGPAGTVRIASCLESSSVSEVLLCYNTIGKEGCDGLAVVVGMSHNLQTLDIRGNYLSAGDTHRLLQSVALSTTLTRLVLASNKLGPEGAERVAKALGRNTYLTSLDLSVNELGPSGAEHIAGMLRDPVSPLQVLQLHGNYLGPSGVMSICAAVKTNKVLKRLTLGNNHATDASAASIAAMLEANYALEALDIRLNTLTAGGLKTIAHQGLAKNTSLRALSLSGNEVGPVGANELAHLFCAHQRGVLEQLDLSSCQLTSSGGVRIASALNSSPSFKELDLSDNGLDDEAAEHLARSIVDSLSISVVDVSCNEIGEEGASHLIDAAVQNPRLVALVTSGNNIPRAAQKKMDNLLEERLSKNRIVSQSAKLAQQQNVSKHQ